MQTLTDFVLRRKRLVGLLWLAAFLVGIGGTALTVQRMTEENAYPGLPAYEANQAIAERYGTGGYERPFVPVVTLPEGVTVDSPGVTEALGRAWHAAAVGGGARVVGYPDTGKRGFVSADGRTTVGLWFPPRRESDGGLPGGGLGEVTDPSDLIRAAMRPELPAGTEVRVTGLDTIAPGADAGGLNVPLKIGLALLGAVLVLWLLFRSLLALLPVLIATVAIPTAFVVLAAASLLGPVHESAVTTMPLIGLGIAIDYSLLLVSRWREERALGHRGDEAVRRAMGTAGRAVLASGAAVAIGLVTLLVLPIPFLRSIAVAGMLIAGFSAFAAITLLPAVLAWWDRYAAPEPGDDHAGRTWSALARRVVRRRYLVVVGTGGVLVALALAGLGLNLSSPQSRHLTTSGPGYEGLAALRQAGLTTGVLTPIDVYAPPGVDPDRLARELSRVAGVRTVAAPDNPDWRRDGTALLTVIPADETGAEAGERTIERLRGAVPDGVMIGGSAAQGMDYVEVTYRAFPLVLGLVALVTFIALARAFRSLLLPLKAILLNLLSLGAVLGALVIVWQWGWGTEQLLGIQPAGTIGTFVPVTVFAFLFGLSMDYEVFILARMREAYDHTGSTTEAVIQGIGRTGRLVTCAALILFCSFAALASGGELDVAIFATGIALGILIDATLVRGLLVPATVSMLGRWNWWLPGWAARLLRVPASPLPVRDPSAARSPVGQLSG